MQHAGPHFSEPTVNLFTCAMYGSTTGRGHYKRIPGVGAPQACPGAHGLLAAIVANVLFVYVLLSVCLLDQFRNK